MDVDIASKVDYLGTGIHNVLISEKQLWLLIADSFAVLYARDFKHKFQIGNHYKPQQKWWTII